MRSRSKLFTIYAPTAARRRNDPRNEGAGRRGGGDVRRIVQLPIRVLSTWIMAPGYGAMDPTGGAFIDGELYTQALGEARDQAKAVADAAVARLQAAGVHAVAEVLEARAADGITSAAGTTELIVMGTRGHTGLKRLLLGSVARGVLHRAHSSVLFVPQAARVP